MYQYLFFRMSWVSVVIVVVPLEYLDFAKRSLNVHGCPESRSKVVFAVGAESRHRSIKIGLKELTNYDVSTIIIHDAVRPAPEEQICSLLNQEAAVHGVIRRLT